MSVRLQKLESYCRANNLILLDTDVAKPMKEPRLVRCSLCSREFLITKIWNGICYPRCRCTKVRPQIASPIALSWPDFIETLVSSGRLDYSSLFEKYYSCSLHPSLGRIPELLDWLRSFATEDVFPPKSNSLTLKSLFPNKVESFHFHGDIYDSSILLHKWVLSYSNKLKSLGRCPSNRGVWEDLYSFYIQYRFIPEPEQDFCGINAKYKAQCMYCGNSLIVQMQKGSNPGVYPVCSCSGYQQFRKKLKSNPRVLNPSIPRRLSKYGYIIPQASVVRWVGGRRFILIKHLACGSIFIYSPDPTPSDKSLSKNIFSCPVCYKDRYRHGNYLTLTDSKLSWLSLGRYQPVVSASIRYVSGRRYVLCRHQPDYYTCGSLVMVAIDSESGESLPQPRACPHCSNVITFRSKRELKYQRYFDSLGIRVIPSFRKLIPPYELDLYLPDYKVAFEFNGYSYHNSATAVGGNLNLHYKSKDYHLLKTESCLAKGVRLYHIWEDTSDDVVSDVIAEVLGQKSITERLLSFSQDVIPRDLFPEMDSTSWSYMPPKPRYYVCSGTSFLPEGFKGKSIKTEDEVFTVFSLFPPDNLLPIYDSGSWVCLRST